MTKTPQEILLGAAEIIQRDGWHQGDLYVRPPHSAFIEETAQWVPLDYDPEYADLDEEAARSAPACAVGAVVRSSCGYARWFGADTKAPPKVTQEALNLLERHLGIDDSSGIPHWNDAPERTAEDVILAMKHAAQIDEVERAADNQ